MNPHQHQLTVTDHGLQTGQDAIGMDRVWLEGHARQERTDLLRFYRHLPSALIGYHQCSEDELRLEYCVKQGIHIARRSSGGGALYLDERQLCFSLVMDTRSIPCEKKVAPLLEFFCTCLSDALGTYKLHPCFKAPNDLEIDGRKLASGFITLLGESVLFQGILLLDVDMATTLKALRVPTEKLSKDGLAGARQRVTTLQEQLYHQNTPQPDLTYLQESITNAFCQACRLEAHRLPADSIQISQPGDETHTAFSKTVCATDTTPPDEITPLESRHKCAGGWLQARIWLGAKSGHMARVELNGNLHCAPHDALQQLQKWLQDSHPSSINERIREFFALHVIDMPGVSAEDIQHLIQLALMRIGQQQDFGLSIPQANRIMCANITHEHDIRKISEQATVMLVPYCAKPGFCKWRHLDNCTECGKCEVGDAYALGRQRGMRIISINNYEHLSATLAGLKQEKVAALIGMCCENFYIKRNHAFTDSGIPMLLLDIHGATCYELGEEEQAYAGTFTAEARLDLPLLQKVMGQLDIE